MPNSRKVNVEVSLSGEARYKKAISELNAANKTMGAELKRLSAEYQDNTDSMDFLSKKGDILQTMLERQQEKIAALKEAVAYASQEYGEASTKTQGYATQLANAQTSEINLKRAIDENNQSIEKAKTAIDAAANAEHGLAGNMAETTAALGEQKNGMISLGDALDSLTGKLGIHIPDAAKQALNDMGSFSAGTVAALGAAAGAVTAFYEGIKSLHEMTVKYAAKADELITKSAATGLSTEFLQAYEYAQNLVDVDLDTFTGSMQHLTDKMADARDGNEKLQEAFRKLGVQVTDASDGSLRPAEQVIMEVIEALHDMKNESERNALASDLFGKSYQNLNPLIVAGTKTLEEYMDAAEDNYVLTQDQIKALGELDDQIQLNSNEWEGLKRQIAAQFAPASKEALENFGKLVKSAGEALIESKIIEGVGEIFEFLSAMLQPLVDLLNTSDGVPDRLKPVYSILHGIAGLLAWITDAANVAIGLVQTLTIVGAKEGLTRIGTAMGYGAKNGNYSNLQKWQGFGDMTGNYYDSSTGLYTGNYGRNAAGTDNWKGGLTWVGENGPELTWLPQGSRILNAQESSKVGGNTVIYVTIDARNVKEFNDIIEMAYDAEAESRMR